MERCERELIDCYINFFKGVKDDLSIKAYNTVRGATRYVPVCVRGLVGEHGSSLQYSCLKDSTDRRAWQAAVHRVAQS